MNKEKQNKPLLTYEQVEKYIDDRITRIEKVAEQMENDRKKSVSYTHKQLSHSKKFLSNVRERIKTCICKKQHTL